MKLKRFLCLAVSLAMVLSMVPALALTASAAGTTGVIDALGGEVLWACPDGSFADTAIEEAFSGWSSNITSGYVNVKTYSVGNTIQYYVNGTANVTTITSPGYGGEGEDAIVIEWVMKRQNPSDLYFDFSFTDKDGSEIAFVKFDKNYTSVSGEYYMGYPAEGTDCAIVATNNGDGTHKVEYYVADSVVSTIESKEGTVNGFGGITSSNGRWSTTWNHIGFANLTIGAVSFSETRVDVTATYTVNGETVHTETGHYDPAEGETDAVFGAYSYSANGSDVMYHTDGATLAESGEIALEAVTNAGTYTVGEVFANGGAQYEVKSGNLVPNGDFAYGTAGWYAADGSAAGFFTSNGDSTMTLTAGGTGVGGANSLYRAWAVESGKKYLFTFETDSANEYHKVSVTDSLATDDTGNTFLNLGGTKNGSITGTNSVVFDATTAYLMINFRWLGAGQTFGNFGLYEIAEAEVHVTEEIESVANIADVAVFGNDTVVLPETVAVTGNLGSNVNAPIEWVEPEVYEGTTTVAGKATVQFGDQAAEEIDVAVNVTIIDEFTIEDFTSVNGQAAGKSNQKVFPVAIRGAFTMTFTANYASFGDLFITIKTANAGFFSPEQIALGSNASAGFRPVNGNGTGGRAADDATLATFTAGKDYGFIVKADASTDKYTVIVYDAATGEVVAMAEDFGFRTNADAIEAITALTNNGAGSVTLTNIKVDTSDVDVCTVTVDGVEKNVVKGQSYAQVLEGAALVDEAGNVYVPVDGVVTVPVDGDMNLTTVALGLEMVSGAQVRIGKPELVEGKLDATADSGLRFLAKANTTDTLLAIADEYGIKVTAEGSDYAAYVKAEKFQDESVFSAAITGLSESNYNRNYTAVGYAIVNGAEITTTDSVTRSIYQVSAGIMNYGKADAEDEAYSVNGIVKDVLNAYLNQTGIRLTVTEDGITVEDGKYTGDVFFIVDCVSDGSVGWDVTITPDTTWGTPAEIASWWTDYVRFNNNNSVAKSYISQDVISEDGVLTFNFSKSNREVIPVNE